MEIRTLSFADDQSTVGASSEPGEPSAPNPACRSIANTVWYTFTAPAEFHIRADTFGSDYDTVIAVYTGTSLGDLINVDCNDDDPGRLQSYLQFLAGAGVTYHFQVGGFEGATGNLAFHVMTPDGDLSPPTITCPDDVAVYDADGPLTFVDIGTATASDDSGTVTVTNDAPTDGLFPLGTTSVTWTATDPAGNAVSCIQVVIVTDLPMSTVADRRFCSFDRDPNLEGQQFDLTFRASRDRDDDDDDDDDGDDDGAPGSFRLRSSNPRGFSYHVFYVGTPGSSVTLDIEIPYPFVTRGPKAIRVHDGARIESGCFVPSDSISGFTISKTGAGGASGSARIRLRDFGCHTPPTPVASCRSVTITVSGTVPSSGLVYVTFRLNYGLKGGEGYGRNAQGDATDRWTDDVVIPNLGWYTFVVSGEMEDTQTIQNENGFESPDRDDD